MTNHRPLDFDAELIRTATDPPPRPFPRLSEYSDLVPDFDLPGVPRDTILRLLEPFAGRRRIFLVALLHGHSMGSAAVAAGRGTSTFDRYREKDPAFDAAVVEAYEIGFHAILEDELYNRALAGPDDRGSVRALELIIKQRDPSYREKRPDTINVRLPLPREISRFSPANLGLPQPHVVDAIAQATQAAENPSPPEDTPEDAPEDPTP